jgi:hypothetical protein
METGVGNRRMRAKYTKGACAIRLLQPATRCCLSVYAPDSARGRPQPAALLGAPSEPRDTRQLQNRPEAVRAASAKSTRETQRPTPAGEQSAHRRPANPNRRRHRELAPEDGFATRRSGRGEERGRLQTSPPPGSRIFIVSGGLLKTTGQAGARRLAGRRDSYA